MGNRIFGTGIAVDLSSASFLSFPLHQRKGEMAAMRLFKETIFLIGLIGGLSLSAFAQRDDKKPPPKEKPPVVTPQPKNPPPKEDPKKPKKPGNASAVMYAAIRIEQA